MKKIKEFFKIKYTKSKSKIYEISIICFMIDLFIKFLVKSKLTPLKEYEIIPNFFYLCFVKNDGGAFSILRGKVWLLSLVGIIMLFFLDRYISNLKKPHKLEKISLGLIIGGIIGNLFDRLIYHGVIDYLLFKFGSYNYPVFNLADSFIVIGIILYLIYLIFIERNNKDDSRGRKHKN